MGKAHYPSMEHIAAEAGCSADQARAAITAALRGLHRASVTDHHSVTAAIQATYFEVGPEACYHFAGILEEARVSTDPELPWSETMMRFAPQLKPYGAVLEKWLQDAEPRPR